MARIGIALGALILAFFAGWYIGHSNRVARIAWLEDELDRYAQAAVDQSKKQLERQQRLIALTKEVSAYELALATGDATACPVDDAYSERLRGILETGR